MISTCLIVNNSLYYSIEIREIERMMVGPIKYKESGSLPHSSVLSDSGHAGDFYGNKMNLVGEFTQDRGTEEFEPLVLTDFRNAGSRPYRNYFKKVLDKPAEIVYISSRD